MNKNYKYFFMHSKETFKAFCSKEKSIPLFLTYDWLETVAGNNWDVVLEEKGGEVIGFLPYVIKKKSGFILIDLPSLTPYGGIWIKYPEGQKYTSSLSYEKEVFTSIIEKLPQFDYFLQKFCPGFSNWLPFYWKGFKQSTAYTYIIDDLKDHDKVFSEFKENIRREIRKAEKSITIIPSSEIKILHEQKIKTYRENKLTFNISEEYLKMVFNFCLGKNCGEFLIAKDSENNIHASALFVWDKNTTYYLFGASDPQYKNSGAMSLLMWEAIKRHSNKREYFNFEGSMIEEVERFFRGFGAKQIPYFVIKKVNSPLLKIKEFIKELI